MLKTWWCDDGGAATSAQLDLPSEHARKTFEIYRTLVEVDTSKTKGNTPKVARYLADELIAAGFPPADIEIPQIGDLASLIEIDKPVVRARYEFAESGTPGLGTLIERYLSERKLV